MELRNLRAFVVAARELHFARAAEKLYISPATMTGLIRQLEADLGASLFTRTTRRVALTDAGVELLARAETILDLIAQASEAVSAVGRGRVGAVRLGVTPPAAPVLAPHLAERFAALDPTLSVDIHRLWLPSMFAALRAGTIDAAITCGTGQIIGTAIQAEVIGREPLLVALRPSDPLVAKAAIDLHELEHRVLGLHSADLFPAWHNAQCEMLAEANIAPPTVELADPDLTGLRWAQQSEVEWIMLTPSMLSGHERKLVKPVRHRAIPFSLLWHARPTIRPVTKRFVETSLVAGLPDGWLAATASPVAGRVAD